MEQSLVKNNWMKIDGQMQEHFLKIKSYLSTCTPQTITLVVHDYYFILPCVLSCAVITVGDNLVKNMMNEIVNKKKWVRF